MGEVFAGRYELLDPIATGGMGSIWRIVDRADGKLKVAKILRQSDAATLLRFVREQSVRIDHTHVVTPLSWAGLDDRVLFTMPLVRGGSVADLVRDHGALPPRWVAAALDQLLAALEAVHGAGIVHRDVKPGNLLLEPSAAGSPHLRLTDFGIAAPVDAPRMTRASVAIGTPGYMPPEQWHGADPDPRADLYAVGRVALEMLTGLRPDARIPGGGQPVPATVTGSALSVLIEHATAEDPDSRPASAAAMRAGLRATGLLDRALEGHEQVTVPDRFALLPSVPPPPSPPPSHAPLSAADSTAATTRGTSIGDPATYALTAPTGLMAPSGLMAPIGATRPAERPSMVPGLALVVLALVGLLVAGVLLLGA